jgi:ATP-dependent DNA helicase RecQ
LRRDAEFDDLPIDFEELDRRKQSEYERLEQMVRMVQSRRCRQLEILEYFGDPSRRICQICDRCAAQHTAASMPSSERVSDRAAKRVWFAIQVALSGAARTHGRIGKQLLAQMLTGSTAKKLKPLRLDRLPTFGRLKQLRQETVQDLLSHLLLSGSLQQIETTRFRPVIQISEAGRSLLQSEVDRRVVEALPGELVAAIAAVLSDADQRPSPSSVSLTRIS